MTTEDVPTTPTHKQDDNDSLRFEAQGICHTCLHRRSVFTCDAFPNGIPTVILTGDRMHTTPYAGDRGIMYERTLG